MTTTDPSEGERPRAVTPDRVVTPATSTTGDQVGREPATLRRGTRQDRRSTLQREKAEFGGMRFFLAFFGWLTATGTVVLLSAIATGVLALIGIKLPSSTASVSTGAMQSAGIVSVIVLAVVLFVGYFTGGYVAGRMARFSGLKQGLAVWLWAIIIAILAAVAGAISANALGAFKQLNTAGLPISGSFATTAGIIALVVAIVFSLGGALLGGHAGMRFHRRVDRFAANA